MSLSPTDFIAKWRNNQLKESTASQSHFNDLCRLLGVDDPISADPNGEWFTFEKGASKTGGGEGWADVWRRGCFAWEYKGPKKDLDKAFDQLLRYSIALNSPPLLIVSDMNVIRIHTNWTNTVQQVHTIEIDDLVDAANRDLLRACFEDVEKLRPTKTRQMLTEEAAREFADISQRLRDRGHEAHLVAHFVIRLVFCMFAEDVRLLPDYMFTKMLRASLKAPERFEGNARKLFAAMSKGGDLDFTPIEWFNGGLFDDDFAFPLVLDDISDLIAAAELDWSEIDPSILGTLFERGLDPDKRSQLGAHYTDRDKIMMIVRPVIIEPLACEWTEVKAKIESLIEPAQRAMDEAFAQASAHSELDEEVRALRSVLAHKAQLELFEDLQRQKRVRALDSLRTSLRSASQAVVAARSKADILFQAFREHLLNFRVLDPACGSGNFLYLALLALKDIEHLANLEAEQLGLPREFPRVGPECVLGIEINPYAAELARVSVWIGEIQWMRRNGFDAAKNPILRNLDTIENRDAVLNEDGTRAKWPAANVVIGNPPFLGNKKMIGELGEDYTIALRRAWMDIPGGVDLVCYWFAKAWAMMVAGKLTRAGLVSTNSIRGGANRDVLKPVVEHGRIFEAWSDEEWTVDGAAVRVSIVCFDRSARYSDILNGNAVGRIAPDLTGTESIDLTLAAKLVSNSGCAFQGPNAVGPFDLPSSVGRSMLQAPINPNGRPNSDVVRPWLNARDMVQNSRNMFIIDFGLSMSETEAMLYELPFEFVKNNVFPARSSMKSAAGVVPWLHQRPRPKLRSKLIGLKRYIATPQTAKYRIFVWLDASVVSDVTLIAIARDDDTIFGILHSRFHELWSLRMGTFLGVGNDPRYTPSTTFETFPFPEGLTPNIPAAAYSDDPRAIAIAAAAARLNELRQNWLNPADLIVREPEVVPGYPDRILPKDEAAAKELSKRTLTNLYNARPAWLEHAHAALDEAVAEAYGWGNDWRAGLLTDDEILSRLFKLNQERAAPSACK